MSLTKTEILDLVQWYETNKRTLPWRDTGDAYDVWLSEIMLQQTRVEFVKERFIHFKEVLPDIVSLAECNDDQLMKLWEGMGYYSRARNLKKCADIVCAQYNGVLPDEYHELLKLPGIGFYTAGAIASIAYNKPVPSVDGNVMRVLARRLNEERDIRRDDVKKEYFLLLQAFYDQYYPSLKTDYPSLPSSLTQALMELGALVCVPNGVPKCQVCPWKDICQAHVNNTTDRIPYRSPLRSRKTVNRTILVIRDEKRFLLHKRPEKGLLAGLYEFIGIEESVSKTQALSCTETLGLEPLRIKPLPDSVHIFSHVEWHMKAFEVMVAEIESLPGSDYLLLTKKELQQFAVPSAFHAYKEYYDLDH